MFAILYIHSFFFLYKLNIVKYRSEYFTKRQDRGIKCMCKIRNLQYTLIYLPSSLQ